jgi:hypothetical protein
MNDFQEQAKNWLRNVVKQNPDKIKAGVEKAGDLIDKQTGGKYAEKVDAVQQKVGGFVDKQNGDAGSGASAPGSTTQPTESTGESSPTGVSSETTSEAPASAAEGESAEAPTTPSGENAAETQTGGTTREP